MNKKEMMIRFIRLIQYQKKLTILIKNLLEYDEIYDYNYIFRMSEYANKVILDIYDNISDNRFNRYVFSFSHGNFDIKTVKDGNVFVTYIYIYNSYDSDNKLLKFANLFNMDNNLMLEYAKSFLDYELVKVLETVLKKPIYS